MWRLDHVIAGSGQQSVPPLTPISGLQTDYLPMTEWDSNTEWRCDCSVIVNHGAIGTLYATIWWLVRPVLSARGNSCSGESSHNTHGVRSVLQTWLALLRYNTHTCLMCFLHMLTSKHQTLVTHIHQINQSIEVRCMTSASAIIIILRGGSLSLSSHGCKYCFVEPV